jgi:hypothetical protein
MVLLKKMKRTMDMMNVNMMTNVTPQNNMMTNVTPQNNMMTNKKNVTQNNMMTNVRPQNNMMTNKKNVTQNNMMTNVRPQNNMMTNVTPQNNMMTNVTPQNNMMTNVAPQNNMMTNVRPQNNISNSQDKSKNKKIKEVKVNNISKTKTSIIPDNKLVEIAKAKIGIIYVYYERINEQKNQTNLSFFIKYGLDEKLWSNLNITTLFVINGHKCEVLIPSKPNIHVLKQDNCSDWEGWYKGIKYFEDTEKTNIWKIFDYLCLINASAIGPIYEPNIKDHWLIPFYNKMVKDNAVLCSPCVSFLRHMGTRPTVVPIMSLIKCSQSIIYLLTKAKIEVPDGFSANHINTVLGKKNDKVDAVCTGEYGLSLILINGGYRVTSLLYDFDCNNPLNYKVNNFTEPDRYMSFNGRNVPLSTIFIKNVWRWNNGYASLPVLYEECKNFVFKKLDMKNIFNDYKDDENYNYSVIKLEPGLHGMVQNWKSNKEYYKKYGVSEERIIFHNFKQDSDSFLIYAHYDSENMIKDYVIQTIQTFIYLGYKILFYTSSSKIENINQVPFKINFVKNEYAGTDWKIWLRGCQTLIEKNVNISYVFLLNDSIILPIHGVENFGNTIQKMRKTCDFWGHWESNEIEWHIIGTPIEFKYAMINDIVQFIEDSIDVCDSNDSNSSKDNYNYIYNMEVKFAKYLINKGYKHNVVINVDTLCQTVCCPVFNPANIDKWINNPDSFAIKWKYMISYLNKNMVSSELNYLTRYLHYGKHGYISNAEKIGVFPKSPP